MSSVHAHRQLPNERVVPQIPAADCNVPRCHKLLRQGRPVGVLPHSDGSHGVASEHEQAKHGSPGSQTHSHHTLLNDAQQDRPPQISHPPAIRQQLARQAALVGGLLRVGQQMATVAAVTLLRGSPCLRGPSMASSMAGT
jgi:hypothetical protein